MEVTMRRLVTSAILVLIVAAILVPRLAVAGQPSVVRFDLQDGNFITGFSYQPHRPCDRPVVVMIHGASDTHTVFDFAPGFRAAPSLAQLGFPVLATIPLNAAIARSIDAGLLSVRPPRLHLEALVACVGL
jgi:hypothetical protein